MDTMIIGLGLATPDVSIEQSSAATLANDIEGYEPAVARFARSIYAGSGVQRRAGVVLEATQARGGIDAPLLRSGNGSGPGTAARMDVYQVHAGTLAVQACLRAIADAGIDASTVTHLVTASCTGFCAPGVDHAVMRGVGLTPTTQRTHVGFMGCHAGVNALRVARAFALSDPSAVVLVCCVELCSLHFQSSTRADAIVANALFADGAAAAVVTGRPSTQGSMAVRSTASMLLPDSADAMAWNIGDFGFSMMLSSRVPALVEQHVRAWLEGWLAGQGIAVQDVAGWAVHPGGPKVLDAVGRALSLPAAAMENSRAVLSEHGNMSSATVFFVLERLRQARKLPAVVLAFGPGLHAEAAFIA